MDHLFLRLESGQILKILPLHKNKIYSTHQMFYIGGKYMFTSRHLDLIDITDKDVRDKVQRTTKNSGVVEYDGMLRLITFTYQIKSKIDEKVDHISNLFESNFKLNVTVKQTGGYPNFSSSTIDEYPLNDGDLTQQEYWESDEYKEVLKQYQDYITYYQVENRSNVLNYLREHDLMKEKYQYLYRGVKINEIRKKRSATTRGKLWEQVTAMIDGFIPGNEHMENIGFQIEGDGKEVHQFMVDGYLFEVNLIDKIK